MVEHHKRRRRKPEAAASVPKKRKTRVATRRVSPTPKLRPIYRIAISLFEQNSGFADPNHKTYKKCYEAFRVLFCITKASDKYNQWGENAVLVKTWDGREAITEFLEGTKGVRSVIVKLMRDELALHLEA